MLAATWLYSLEVLGGTIVYVNLNVSVKYDIPDIWLYLSGRQSSKPHSLNLLCVMCLST